MSVPSKTPGRSLLTMQSIATGTLVVGSAFDVSTYFSGDLAILVGRTATTALTASPRFTVEYSGHASNDSAWYPKWSFTSDPALDLVAAEAEAVSGTVAAAATTITVASTTNLTIGEFIALSNGASSELRRIKTVTTNTNITVDAIVNAATGLTLYDQAQIITISLNFNNVSRVRAIVDTTGVGSSVLVGMVFDTLDSVG